MAIAFLTSGTGGGEGSSSTINAAALSITAGNLIIVTIANGTSTTRVLSLTDTAGNQYHNSGVVSADAASGASEIWFANNCLGNAGNIVIATLSVADTFRNIHVLQYSGADQTNPLLGATIGVNGAGTLVASAGKFVPESGSLIVATGSSSAVVGTFTPGNNYAIRVNQTIGTLTRMTEDRINTPVGNNVASYSVDVSMALSIIMAVFRPVPSTRTVYENLAPQQRMDDVW